MGARAGAGPTAESQPCLAKSAAGCHGGFMDTPKPTRRRRVLAVVAVLTVWPVGAGDGSGRGKRCSLRVGDISSNTSTAAVRGDIRPVVPETGLAAVHRSGTGWLPVRHGQGAVGLHSRAEPRSTWPSSGSRRRIRLKIGSVFFNPGGPGGSGVDSLPGVVHFLTRGSGSV